MVVHAGAGHSSGTLVNALLHRLGKLSGAGGALRPGIVHRLDRETSGAMVVARNDKAHEHLSEQFRSRNVRKIYLALVHGKMPRDSGTITLPISRDPHRRTRMTARAAKGPPRPDRLARDRAPGPLHAGRSRAAHRAHAPDPRALLRPSDIRSWETRSTARRAACAPARAICRCWSATSCTQRGLDFRIPSSGAWVEVRAPLPRDLRVYFEQVGASLGWRAAEIEAALAPYVEQS